MREIESEDFFIVGGRSAPFEISKMVCNINVNVKVDSCFTFSCEIVRRLPNLKRWKLSTTHMPGLEGVGGEVKSVSWGNARTKGELASISSSLTQLIFTI